MFCAACVCADEQNVVQFKKKKCSSAGLVNSAGTCQQTLKVQGVKAPETRAGPGLCIAYLHCQAVQIREAKQSWHTSNESERGCECCDGMQVLSV